MPHPELKFEITESADGEIFRSFFDGYRQAFVLPEEMEDEDGFRSCLQLNHNDMGRQLKKRYGPFREVCAIAHDPETGIFVGGANFLAVDWSRDRSDELVLANLNYLYLDQAQRGKGYFRSMIAGLMRLISEMFDRRNGKALVFIEQNDPIAMSNNAYQRDTQFTGMDQFDRLRIWSKVGALYVDIPYVQPPLSDDHPPVDTLILSVLGAEGRSSLSAEMVHYQMERFFAISVLKGAPINTNLAARKVLVYLDTAERKERKVALVDIRPLLDSLGPPETTRALFGPGERFKSLLADVGVS